MPLTVRAVATDACYELGALAEGEALSADLGALVVSRFNQLLDTWNADQEAVYAQVFTSHTLTPSLNPHTIGPTAATFTVTQRPVSIDSASLLINGASYGLEPLTATEWGAISVPGLTSAIPTSFYYAPSWPNGSIYLYPIPTSAITLDLETRTLLTAVTLDTTFSLPPGYQHAIMLTLAEDLAAPLGKPPSPDTAQKAAKARARIFRNNLVVPEIDTRQAGVPGSRGGWFDYLIGRVR